MGNDRFISPIVVATDQSQLKSINFYLMCTSEHNVLIDTGVANDSCWDMLVNTLRQHRLTLYDLDAILLTHHHSDHSGLVNQIRDEVDIPLYAHKESIYRLKRLPEFLYERVHFFESYYKKMGAESELAHYIDHLKLAIEQRANQAVSAEITPVQAGDKLFNLQVIHTPGHAPDHISLWHEQSGSMFVGDHLLKDTISHALV